MAPYTDNVAQIEDMQIPYSAAIFITLLEA